MNKTARPAFGMSARITMMARLMAGLVLVLVGSVMPDEQREVWVPESIRESLIVGRASLPSGTGSLRSLSANRDRLVVADSHKSLLWYGADGRFLHALNLATAMGNTTEPRGVAMDSNGVTYVVDGSRGRVDKITPDGKLDGFIDLTPFGPYGPSGIALDQDGSLFVTDTGMNRILALSKDGQLIRSIGSQGSEAGKFKQPSAIAVDRTGRLYVADSVNNRVQVLDAEGRHLASIGTGSSPTAVAVDDSGRVYVLRPGDGQVAIFDQLGNPLGSIGNSAVRASTSSNFPLGLAASQPDRLLLLGADGIGNVALRYTPRITSNSLWQLRLLLVALGIVLVHFPVYLRRSGLPLLPARPLPLGIGVIRSRLLEVQIGAREWVHSRLRRSYWYRSATGDEGSLGRMRIIGTLAALILAGMAQFAWSARLGTQSQLREVWPGLSWEYQDTIPGLVLFLPAALLFHLALGRWSPAKACDYVEAEAADSRNEDWRFDAHAVLFGAVGVLGSGALAIWLWNGIYHVLFPVLFIGALSCLGLMWLRLDRSRLVRVSLRTSVIEIAYLGALAAAFWLLNGRDVTSPHYSAIGDEYGFFQMAKRIAVGEPINIFSMRGVWEYHPVMDSAFQALSMRIFGISLFGWKMSTAIAVLIALPPLYWLTRLLFGGIAAAVAAAVLVSSHYLFAYVHAGYNNLNPIPVVVMAMWLLLLSLKYRSAALAFLCGAATALGFYTFYSSRVAIAIVVSYLVLSRRTVSLRWSVFPLAVGFVAALAPLLATDQSYVLTAMFRQSAFGELEDQSGRPLPLIVAEGVFRSVLAFNYNTKTGIGVAGSLLDPVTGVLSALGLVMAVLAVRVAPFRFILLWYTLSILAVGGLSKYPYVSTSRLHFLLPVVAIFAGLAVSRVVGLLARKASSRSLRAIPVVLSMIVPLVFGLNIYRFWYESPRWSPVTTDALALELAYSQTCGGASSRPSIIVAPGPESNLRPALDSNGLGPGAPILVSHREMNRLSGYADSPCIIFTEPRSPDVQQLLQQSALLFPGKNSYPYSGSAGVWPVTYLSASSAANPDGRIPVSSPRDLEISWWLFLAPVLMATALFAKLAGPDLIHLVRERELRAPWERPAQPIVEPQHRGGMLDEPTYRPAARLGTPARRLWRGEVVPLGLAIAIALGGQFLLGQKGGYWPGLVLFGIAASLGVPAMGRVPRKSDFSTSPSTTCNPTVGAGIVGRKRWVAWGLALVAAVCLASLVQVVHTQPAKDSPGAILLWLAGISSASAATILAGRVARASSTLSLGSKTRSLPWQVEGLMLAGTLAVAALLRVPGLDQIPPMMHMDPAEQGLWALKVIRGESGGLFGSGYAGASNFTFGLSAAGILAFGNSAVGLRSVSVVFGLLSILLTYLWARELFGLSTALITGLLMSVAQYHIHFSREGCFYIQSAFSVALTFFLYWRALRTGRSFYFLAIGFGLALGMLVYYAGRIALIVVVLFECYRLVVDRIDAWSRIRQWFLVVAGFVLFFGPWAVHYFGNPQALVGRSEVVLIFNPEQMNHLMNAYGVRDVPQVLAIELRNVLEMFNYRGDSSTQWGWPGSFLDSWTASLLVIGVAYSVSRLREPRFVFCAVWLGSVVLVGGVLTGGMPFAPRMVVLLPLIFVFPALVLSRIGHAMRLGMPIRLHSQVAGVGATSVVILVLLAISWTNHVDYYQTYVTKVRPADDITLLGRYLGTIAERNTFYLISPGGEDRILQHATVRFLSREAKGTEVNDFSKIPTFVDSRNSGGGTAIIVWGPMMTTQAEKVELAYPQAVRHDQHDAHGRLAFRSYLIAGDQPHSGDQPH